MTRCVVRHWICKDCRTQHCFSKESISQQLTVSLIFGYRTISHRTSLPLSFFGISLLDIWYWCTDKLRKAFEVECELILLLSTSKYAIHWDFAVILWDIALILWDFDVIQWDITCYSLRHRCDPMGYRLLFTRTSLVIQYDIARYSMGYSSLFYGISLPSYGTSLVI
jgi:hypothetical protein